MPPENDKILAALFRAQKNMGSAKKSSENPYFKSKYANLESVFEACEPALNAEGIMIVQPCDEKGVYTWLVHVESGQILSTLVPYTDSAKTDMQKLGGAITYGRRYGLQSLLALPTEDDDGETAVGRVTPGKAVTLKEVKERIELLEPAKAKVAKAHLDKIGDNPEELKKLNNRVVELLKEVK